MNGFILIFLITAYVSLAKEIQPPVPSSLLPPLKPRKEDSPVKAPSPADLNSLMELEDPSTLLEIDEKKTVKSPYDKKMEEVSQKLLLPSPRPQTKHSTPLFPIFQNSEELSPNSPSDKNTASSPHPPLLSAMNALTPKSSPPMLSEKTVGSFSPHPPLLSAINLTTQEHSPPPSDSPSEAKVTEPSTDLPDFSLLPMMSGIDLPGTHRGPSSLSTAPPVAVNTPVEAAPILNSKASATQRLPLPKTTALAPLPGVADIAVILSNNQFFPSKIRLIEGVQTRLIFTTTNKKPAALVMERLHIQRWLAKEKEPVPSSELERAHWEINRELSASKTTEIVLDPKEGAYSFHDAISGATGEIEVEKK